MSKVITWQTFNKSRGSFANTKTPTHMVMKKYGFYQAPTIQDDFFWEPSRDKETGKLKFQLVDGLSIKKQIERLYHEQDLEVVYKRWDNRAQSYVEYHIWLKGEIK